ncbi:MAG: hypothetical protein DLM72_20550 [Candidatus Nitrosopolaris wilkensis]|nr:MAG: hypothetical protein DLM72_20550 [Candidatus Nitrosopolaris wilkensis]
MSLTYNPRFDDIKDMSIADGLKELLIDYGFTSERLIRLSPSDLASILGIDVYVSKIIHNAAKNQLRQRESGVSNSTTNLFMNEHI